MINILPREIAELIAAGEVVERPASVVKEMIENSIDAGATTITAEIQRGGIMLIRISDNGSGVMREDVEKAFLRHATSKISQKTDLDAIGTLGFRGEALAAIAAVSKVEMITKHYSEAVGTRYAVSSGVKMELIDAGCPDGTTIIVKDIFFNTPARMKFLKKDTSEGNAVAGVVDRLALSHPEVAFKLIRDGKVTLQTPGDSKLISAIYAVCGRDFASNMIPVSNFFEGVSIKGYVCKPTFCKPNRNGQFVVLNGRFVRSGTVSAALDAAYKNSVMVSKFPCSVLCLDVPLHAVDVNVHPSKIEVRFSDEKKIFDTVYYGVKNALTSGDTRPSAHFTSYNTGMVAKEYKQTLLPNTVEQIGNPERVSYDKMLKNHATNCTGEQYVFKNTKQPFLETNKKTVMADLFLNNTVSLVAGDETPNAYYDERISESANLKASDLGKQIKNDADYFGAINLRQVLNQSEQVRSIQNNSKLGLKNNFKNADGTVQARGGGSSANNSVEKNYNENANNSANQIIDNIRDIESDDIIEYIGEAFKTYIIVRKNNSLFLIDKHAAHERIIFEELKNTVDCQQQELLIPVTVTLTKEEYSAVIEDLQLFSDLGFEIEDFGDKGIIVRSIPAILLNESIEILVSEIAGNLLACKGAQLERYDDILHTMACRSAVKAGNKSSASELEHLARQVLCSNKIMYCPHGRPVAIELSKKDLDKQFGRIV